MARHVEDATRTRGVVLDTEWEHNTHNTSWVDVFREARETPIVKGVMGSSEHNNNGRRNIHL